MRISIRISVGYVHYFCAGSGILSEATGFIRNEPFDVHVQPGVKHTIQVRKMSSKAIKREL